MFPLYKVKYALLRIAVSYFWICACMMLDTSKRLTKISCFVFIFILKFITSLESWDNCCGYCCIVTHILAIKNNFFFYQMEYFLFVTFKISTFLLLHDLYSRRYLVRLWLLISCMCWPFLNCCQVYLFNIVFIYLFIFFLTAKFYIQQE